ncbi:hypothetical protein QE152_g857 [Popillia japonica]|uniref:Uncharacterized protein n=1 Tax=Popillia japonica TaxID=7064 RepID=A0AAW1NAB4_POPJA
MILLLVFLLPISEQFAFLSDYGQLCDNYTECEENNKTCTCIRYYEWRGYDTGCVEIYDGEKIMRLEIYFNNTAEEIARKQEKVFNFQLWAGGFVVAVYIVAVLSVMLFCVYVRSADAAVRRDLEEFKLSIQKNKKNRKKSEELLA